MPGRHRAQGERALGDELAAELVDDGEVHPLLLHLLRGHLDLHDLPPQRIAANHRRAAGLGRQLGVGVALRLGRNKRGRRAGDAAGIRRHGQPLGARHKHPDLDGGRGGLLARGGLVLVGPRRGGEAALHRVLGPRRPRRPHERWGATPAPERRARGHAGAPRRGRGRGRGVRGGGHGGVGIQEHELEVDLSAGRQTAVRSCQRHRGCHPLPSEQPRYRIPFQREQPRGEKLIRGVPKRAALLRGAVHRPPRRGVEQAAQPRGGRSLRGRVQSSGEQERERAVAEVRGRGDLRGFRPPGPPADRGALHVVPGEHRGGVVGRGEELELHIVAVGLLCQGGMENPHLSGRYPPPCRRARAARAELPRGGAVASNLLSLGA
mmetsp:Transcript_24187/g.76023  ORF Transcript_24187/g.76023 Transcript_24187/m.76023 type:complete len:378 (-) Transcript_24187:333-1466(-)